MQRVFKYFVTKKDGPRIYVDTSHPLGEGGQGSVFPLIGNSKVKDSYKLVAKLFDDLDAFQEKKLLRLVEMRQKGLLPISDCIGFPRKILYYQDRAGRLLCKGFTMERFPGQTLSTTVFKPLVVRDRMGWSRIDICTLAIELLKRFHALHETGFLVGDIKPENILITSDPRQVAIVDADSFQFEDYACPVHTKEFTAPRLLQTSDFSQVMRTPEDERYAVAVLLFKMMLIGKNPFARSDGRTLEEYIADRDFVFPLGYDEAELMPKGPWQLIWFNMPLPLRKAFYNAFRDGRYLKTEEWISLVEEYRTQLSAGRYPADIFPNITQAISRQTTFSSLRDRDVDPSVDADLMARVDSMDNVPHQDGAPYLFLRMHTNYFRLYRVDAETFLASGMSQGCEIENFSLEQMAYVREDGSLDIQRFVGEKHDGLNTMKQRIQTLLNTQPCCGGVYAFGGSLLRKLTNRRQVIETLEQRLDLRFGLFSHDDESRMSIELCRWEHPALAQKDIVVVNVSALCTRIIISRADGSILTHRLNNLGYTNLRERLFATSQSTLATEEMLHRHDADVELELDNVELPVDAAPTLIVAGVINESYTTNRLPKEETLQPEMMRRAKVVLTSQIVTNRNKAGSMATDMTGNRYLAGMLRQRMAMPIYIVMAERLRPSDIFIQNQGTAQAVILHTIHKSQQQQISAT